MIQINTTTIVLLILQATGSALLFWSSFCRLRFTDGETLLDIRMVIWLQSVSAVAVFVAPFAPLLDPQAFDWPALSTPLWVWVFAGLLAAAVQIVTARHWHAGVPRSYIKPECRPQRRATDFEVTR